LITLIILGEEYKLLSSSSCTCRKIIVYSKHVSTLFEKNAVLYIKAGAKYSYH
jgi:hypothetical protein